MDRIETTLALLKQKDEVLLAMKKRGFGEDKYNGVGVKLKEEETSEEAMIRETGEIDTKHETRPVYFAVCSNEYNKLHGGALCDIAPST